MLLLWKWLSINTSIILKVNGKIGKYDAYEENNKNSKLWIFLNQICDRIAGHSCNGHYSQIHT